MKLEGRPVATSDLFYDHCESQFDMKKFTNVEILAESKVFINPMSL